MSQLTLRSYEDFKARLSALPVDQQVRVLRRAFDLVYAELDEKVWRTVATSIKFAKETGLEGHENFNITETDLKKLTHIQDIARRKKD